MILVVGSDGTLGSALLAYEDCVGTTRRPDKTGKLFYYLDSKTPEFKLYDAAILCAGKKGFAECEGDRGAFRSDVDGNIRLVRQLLKEGTFVTFISTDAVEWGANTAYARNRLLVETAIVMQPNVAIVRPSKFSADNASVVAEFVYGVTKRRDEGVHYWGLR